MILQTINDEALNIQAIEDKGNKVTEANSSNNGAGDRVDGSIKYWSIVVNLAKSKKAQLIKLKKLDLPNIKANFGTDFLTLRVKKTFIHL